MTLFENNRSAFLEKLSVFGKRENIPNISWEGVVVLRFFLEIKKPKKVLEIGSANGFSGIIIADMLEEWGGFLLTTDVSKPSIESAKINFQKAKLENIEIRFGDALEICSKKDGPFDLIFIDGEKKRTHEFFQFAQKLLSKEGIIIIDDVRKFSQKMELFWRLFSQEQTNWDWIEIPVDKDDAMLVMIKKETHKTFSTNWKSVIFSL